ncbi:MAG: hypothetical protein FWB85_11225, partial [Chitinispirillia bacterium]|nr:hypothetical protein [Chitinispirillia bacterium]
MPITSSICNNHTTSCGVHHLWPQFSRFIPLQLPFVNILIKPFWIHQKKKKKILHTGEPNKHINYMIVAHGCGMA